MFEFLKRLWTSQSIPSEPPSAPRTSNPPLVPGKRKPSTLDHAWTLPNEDPSDRTDLPRSFDQLLALLRSGRAPAGIALNPSRLLNIGFALRLIRTLPPKFNVNGDFDLSGCTRLRIIGDGLTINSGDLKISAPIRALPEKLAVYGSLELHACHLLERFPGEFYVSKSITIRACSALKCLPDGLTVNESLNIIGGQQLAELPKRLWVKGDMLLSGTRVTALPSDLRVGGSLIVEGRSRLTDIPESIVVGGDLVLRHCKVQSLPAHLRLMGSLRLQGAPTSIRLPPYSVPNVLDLEGCEKLEELPAGIFAHHLKLRGCTSLKKLPAGLHVPGVVDLRQCRALTELPPNMRIGFSLNDGLRHAVSFILTGCSSLATLPADLEVHGNVEVAGSGLRELPPKLSGLQLCWRGVRVPHDVVFDVHSLPPARVFGEQNAELRRVIMERIGASKLLAAAKAETVDADTDPGGERKLLRIRLRSLPELMYLFCRCPSTKREYLLRVPLETRTCRQAAAWIAGFDNPSQYQPLKET